MYQQSLLAKGIWVVWIRTRTIMVQTYIVPDLTISRLILDHLEDKLKLEAVFNLMVTTKH